MEFPNLNPHHQLIQEQLESENHSSTSNDLNTTTSLNDNATNIYQERYLPNLGEFRSNHLFVDHSPENPIGPDFGYTCQKTNEHVPTKLKEDSSVTFPSFSDMLCSSSNMDESGLLSSSRYKQQLSIDGSTNSWLSSLSMRGCLSTQGLYIDAPNTSSSRGLDASHLFPGTNFPASDMPSPFFSGSLGLNLQTMDFLATRNYSGSPSQSFYDSNSLFRDSMRCSSLESLQASRDVPPYNSINNQPVFSGATTSKRATNLSAPKISNAEAKKPRSSCPPLKIRKEKLGDRIAALQRLVSPFGKTDTASVLTEAIGYIQFLHDQIQTLSVPYMKSSQQGCPSAGTLRQQGSVMEDGREESKRDLKSRGLCLVPVSCASYINNYE